MSGLPYECPGCYRNVRKGLLVLAVGVVVVVAVDVDVVDVLFVDGVVVVVVVAMWTSCGQEPSCCLEHLQLNLDTSNNGNNRHPAQAKFSTPVYLGTAVLLSAVGF